MNIKKIIKTLGGPTIIGRRCNRTSQAVSQWTKVPPEHVLTLESMGKLTRYQIRPDIFGKA